MVAKDDATILFAATILTAPTVYEYVCTSLLLQTVHFNLHFHACYPPQVFLEKLCYSPVVTTLLCSRNIYVRKIYKFVVRQC